MASVVCEWGLAGIEAWRQRAAAFVIVDVLSFSTAVSVAVERGARIIPFAFGDPQAAAAEAARRGAVAASPRRTLGGQLSLSPASLRRVARGDRILLPSPNGSRLSLATGDVPTFCGGLRNAAAVAEAAMAEVGEGTVAVIAAGERWPDHSLRPAIEDWLGAGAIIQAMAARENAEARLARLAFEAAAPDLAALLRASLSGRELIDRGFAEDAEIALDLNADRCAPRLADGAYGGG
jgi:2-phosphosulfolactate phosphatase